MVAANPTNQLPTLKRLWGNKVQEPLYKASKAFALMQKDTNFGGEGRYVVVTVAPTAGGSATFAQAVANQNPTQEVRFFITHKKEYQVFSIQGDVIARSRGDKNAMVEQTKHQADKARYSFARIIARRIWSIGGGAIGRPAAGSAMGAAEIILRNISDVRAFEAGMWIQLAANDGTGVAPAAPRDSGKKLQILSVNRGTGGVTVNGLWSDIAGATANDWIFRAGDHALAMTGIRGWNPEADPTAAEDFWGVDRTDIDIQRTSGVRVNGGGQPKEETLLDAGAEAQMSGMDKGDCFANPRDVTALIKELGSKRFIDVKTDMATVGFEGVLVVDGGPGGTMRVFSDPDVPQGYFWIEDMSKIYMRTAGDCPMALNEDGVGRLLRAADDDSYQGRLGTYGNIFHENPGHGLAGTW